MYGFQLKQCISSFLHKKAFQPKQLEGLNAIMVRPAGIEPANMASVGVMYDFSVLLFKKANHHAPLHYKGL